MLEKEGSIKNRIKHQLTKIEEFLIIAPESKCDLVDGNFLHHSPASYKHNKIRGFFESVIRFFVEKHHIGEVISEIFPIKLNENNWREPDLAIITNEHLKNLKETIFTGIPTFIIEIVSEDSRYRDEIRKRAEYEQLGVKEYWIIDPDSFERSIFLKKTKDRFNAIQYSTDRIESLTIKGLFFKKTWIWSESALPPLEVVFKDLNLI
ncbi:MAG: Uma2 family endonuclease [Candidatus Helarchaeota archaeon]